MPRFAGLHKNISNDTSAAQNGAENNTVTTTDASSNNILQPSNLTTTTATSANIMNNITDNTVVGKRTPIFKMSTTRRQRATTAPGRVTALALQWVRRARNAVQTCPGARRPVLEPEIARQD